MSKKLFISPKKILTIFIIGTTVMVTLPTPALASTGDFWKGSTKIGSIQQLILTPSKFLDLIVNMNSYFYEVNGKIYKASEANDIFIKNSKSSITDIQNMIESQLSGTPLNSLQALVGTFDTISGVPSCQVTLPDKTQTVTSLTVDGVTQAQGAGYSVSNGEVDITNVTANNVIIITTADGSTYTVLQIQIS
ncbi:hypothetical protein [Desulfosporosinus sp. FKA]|uniref:hypothetical protein n=1 Tax=Desulfosporosinus sp. FKA TaxID=1969834 RepID=UPI000B4A27E2|nr:hypothetical protein [Desulfosporosinus sp. FKA]